MSILLLSTLVAGCGAASGLASGSSSESTSGTTSSGGTGGSGSSSNSSGSTSSGISFPLGTFTRCAKALQGPDGNDFLNAIGIVSGATLTVTQQGSTVTATYADPGGASDTFAFEPTTSTSAVLVPEAVASGFSGLCVQGPGDFQSFPATVTATSGMLTYEASTMFVSLTGTISGDGGPCGALSAPENLWIICDETTGGTAGPPDTGAPVPEFPVGTYACSSEIATYDQAGGMQEYVASGGTSGTLVVTQSGMKVTAAYTGDTSLSGTLDFTVTTSASANADLGQTLLTPCLVPISLQGPPPPDTPETLAVAAGSLVMNDTTLFLSINGTMASTPSVSSTCPGAMKMGNLVCTKQ